MDIGPINAIRSVPPLAPPRRDTDLSGVFAIEFRHQEQNDSDTARRPPRGLEAEEDEDDLTTEDAETPRSKLSVFA